MELGQGLGPREKLTNVYMISFGELRLNSNAKGSGGILSVYPEKRPRVTRLFKEFNVIIRTRE
jgi:hypothetical protein